MEWLFTPIIGSEKEVKGGLAIFSGINFPGVENNLLLSLRTGLEVNYFWYDTVRECFGTTDGMGVMTIDTSMQENRMVVVSKQVPGMLGVNGEKDYFYQKVEKFIDPLPQNAEFWDILKKKKEWMIMRLH